MNCYGHAMNKYNTYTNPRYNNPGILGGEKHLVRRPIKVSNLVSAINKDLKMMSVAGSFVVECSGTQRCRKAVEKCYGRRVYGYVEESSGNDYHFIVNHNRSYWSHKWGRQGYIQELFPTRKNSSVVPPSKLYVQDRKYSLSLSVCLP